MTLRHHVVRAGDCIVGGFIDDVLDTIFPGTGKAAEEAVQAVTPKLPAIPAAPVSPDNDPAAQAKIAEAAQREREREAKRKGRASTILAGESAGALSTAKRSLLGA